MTLGFFIISMRSNFSEIECNQFLITILLTFEQKYTIHYLANDF
jgi:hypothetical protein